MRQQVFNAIWIGIFLSILSGWPAVATAQSTSLQPMPRPAAETTGVRDTTVPVFYNAEIRPRPRPNSATTTATRLDTPVFVASTAGVTRSPRPEARPRRFQRRVARREARESKARETRVVSRRGSVCRDKGIKGQNISAIAGSQRGCGISDPVRVTSVDGVTLTQSAIMDCTTAKALKTWVQKGLKPTVGRTGGGVKSLRVASHYSCRTRNSRRGAKISEHGKGKAIDISAINLADGSSISVLKDWGRRKRGKILKRAHKAACGPFGTVLGPNSDRYHQDHFHFDTARYRGGPYCR